MVGVVVNGPAATAARRRCMSRMSGMLIVRRNFATGFGMFRSGLMPVPVMYVMVVIIVLQIRYPLRVIEPQ